MDQVKTSIENGVLTVTVPKAEVKKPGVKPIQITGKPTLPTNFEVTWAKLKSAICAIFLKQPDSCDLEKLYQAVSDLCIYKMAENLYQRIEMECEADISTALQSLVGQSPDLVIFLSLVERYWQDLCESVDRTLLNHLLKMFTTLEIYAESFEKPFLECTSKFYAAQGMKYMQQSDVPDYLKHVEIRLQEEHDRCLIYLDASTRKPLIATPEKQLLERHIPAILDKFDHSISDNIGETKGGIGGHVLCAIDMPSFRVSDNAGWEAFGKESERDGVTCGGGAGWKRGLYPTMTEVKALEKKSLKRT
ncbi:hypothetical protein AHAS_Ahas12G0068100 [Arachis hypogaea]